MKVLKTRLFSNPFTSRRFTDIKLRNFAEDVLVRLQNANSEEVYTTLINQLNQVLTEFGSGLNEVDCARNHKKTKTKGLNEAISEFKQGMSDLEGVVANALGGFKSPGYLDFYPAGVTEYRQANLDKLPILLKRVSKESMEYSALLGKDIASRLQSFELKWQDSHDSKTTGMALIAQSKTRTAEARISLENKLYEILYTMNQKFAGREQQIRQFFDINLLYGGVRTKSKEKNEKEEKPVLLPSALAVN